LSTPAIELSDAPLGLRVLRWLDLVVLALALPVFVLADLPMVGYAGAAILWLGQRAVREVLARQAKRADDVRTSVGLNAASMIGRGWVVALGIFGTYLVGGTEAGLAASVLILALFTLFFAGEAVLRPFDSPAPRRDPAP
jgi:hypothetical protein